jgi:hypothetical protein
MDDLWGPLLGVGVGIGMLVMSRRYIHDTEEFARTSPSAKRRDYWTTVGRGERLTQPVAWGLILVGVGLFVVRLFS